MTLRTTSISLGWVTAGAMVANAAAFAVHVPASRWLSTSEYGEFAVVLAWLLVVAVPALAVQAVIARESVRGVDDATLRRLGLRLTGLVGAVALVASPLVSAVSKIGIVTVLVGIGVAPLLTLVAIGQGLLQGHQRFRVLGGVLAFTGIARSVPMVVGLAVTGTVTGALVSGLVGAALAAAVAWWVSGRGVGGRRCADSPAPTPALWTVLAASQVQLVIVIASSVDLLLSRTALSASDAGVYAVGAVALKVAFWLPQAVGVVFYPRMADPRQTVQSIRGAVAVVGVLGALLVVAAVVAGPIVPIIAGEKYRDVVPTLWLFTYAGVMLSVLQVLLLALIATRRTRWSAWAWLVVLGEVVAIVTVASTVTVLVGIAATAATVATLGYLLAIRRWAHSLTWVQGQHNSDDQHQHAENAGDQRDNPTPQQLRP